MVRKTNEETLKSKKCRFMYLRPKIAFLLCIFFAVTACTRKDKNTSEGSSSKSNEAGFLPGVIPVDSKLREKFSEMKKERGSAYKPRTKHLYPDGWAQFTNRLFLESSPYLIQHAHNPVNWYPWGDEAFREAKRLNRPVFLSVGYSTCHWCHVMEEESFEDIEIARAMNENYIAIKVDREERPDIDAIYMSAVQAMTGHGGWPMNVWLTPERKPFFGGTYFPARDGDRGVRAGFLTILKKLREVYDVQPDKVAESSQQVADGIEKILTPISGTVLPEANVLKRAATYYRSNFDSKFGGLSGAPKFPSRLPVRFLLRYHKRTQDKEALNAVKVTLEKMAAGGIHDHVAGGFHRYSTDEKWLIPHFEKMLYDNALLAMAYLEGYQVTHKEQFKKITRKILRYVKRDMTSPEGAFYSATDADSPAPNGKREEGWFFTWTPEEIDLVLSKDVSKLMRAYYTVTPSGNFEGRNILNTPEPLSKIAKKFRLGENAASDSIEEGLDLLYEARAKRRAPLRDEKILTSWNGLMISAFAKAGLILKEEDYIVSAKRAADFILSNLYKNGALFRTFKDGKAKQDAFLDDYAFFIAALIDLYESTFDLKWLNHAITLDQVLEKYFEDKNIGGFFMTGNEHEKLLAREKPSYDGAEPSGNSVTVLNLLRLHEFTTNDSYRKRAEKSLKAFSGTIESNPVALSEMLLAIDFHLDKPKEIVIVAPKGGRGGAEPLLEIFRNSFVPNSILAVLEEGDDLRSQSGVIPLVKEKRALNGRVTAYVCEKGLCKFPTSDPQVFSKQISQSEAVKQ